MAVTFQRSHVPRNFTDYWRYLDYFAVSAEMPENYQAPLDFILTPAVFPFW